MKRDIFIRHHRVGLRIFGAWPESEASYAIVYHFGIGLLTFFLTIAVWNIVDNHGDLEELMDILVAATGTVSGLFKMVTIYIKRRNLRTLVSKISEDWNNKSEEILPDMRENCTRSQLLSKMITLLYNTMNFTYILRTLMSYIFDTSGDRKFLAQITFPFDARQSPYYEIIVTGQILSTFICFNGHALIEGLLATSVLHASSKVTIVQKEIVRFSWICQKNYGNKKLVLMALRRLAEKHLKFIEFSEDIEDVFSYVSFFHVMFLTLMQVVSGYMFLDGLERGAKVIVLIHYATLTASFLVSAGYYCIAGEYLTSQSEFIFHELRNCQWYKFQIDDMKVINFMLMKAWKPVNLTVGKFSNLSLLYLTSILKTSFSYLSLVRAVEH